MSMFLFQNILHMSTEIQKKYLKWTIGRETTKHVTFVHTLLPITKKLSYCDDVATPVLEHRNSNTKIQSRNHLFKDV